MISHNLSLMLLRFSLGIIFFWFGVLKLFNVSPVLEIIKQSLPLFLGESQLFLFALALVEILIGLAFLANRFVKIAAIVMIVHLCIASVAVLITQGFAPRFPVLSLAGEFVIKNLTLIAAAFVLIAEKKEPKEKGKE